MPITKTREEVVQEQAEPRSDLVWIADVPKELPYYSLRQLRRMRTEKSVSVYLIGSKIYFSRQDLIEYPTLVPAQK